MENGIILLYYRRSEIRAGVPDNKFSNEIQLDMV